MSIGIIATVIGIASQFVGRNADRDIRTQSYKIVRAVAYCYHEAQAQNRYYRVAFDLDKQSYLLESSDKAMSVAVEGDEKEVLRKRKEAERLKSSGFDENAVDDTADPSAEPSGEENPDQETPSPKKPDFTEVEDDILDKFDLPEDVKIKQIYIQHQKEAATTGKAWLYCFPRGQTEFAVIQLAQIEDEEEGDVMTLGVSPITGRVSVYDEDLDQEEVLKRLGGASQ